MNPQNRDCALGREQGSLQSSPWPPEESPASVPLYSYSANRLADMPYRHQRRADYVDVRSDDLIHFFLPSEGIEYDVIAADIQFYLGPNASVEQTQNPRKDRNGYYIRSPTGITIPMISDLKRDTLEWTREQKSDPGLSYVASRTYCNRHQCHPRNYNTLGAVSMDHDCDLTPMMDFEKPADIDQFSRFIPDTESRVFERVSLPQVGFTRSHFGGIVDQASARKPGALCASSGRISLASLKDVHLYLTEIDHVVGEDESKTREIYLECVRLKSFVRALRRLREQETGHEWVTEDHE
jgi:hypothetical protein